jgi:hypothetical protein
MPWPRAQDSATSRVLFEKSQAAANITPYSLPASASGIYERWSFIFAGVITRSRLH